MIDAVSTVSTVSTSATLLRRRLDGRRDLLALAAAHPQRYPGLLESAADGAGARWDILFAFPQTVIESRPNGAGAVDFLSTMDEAWSADSVARLDDDLPFRGGWLLYLGYELAAQIERRLDLPEASTALPTAVALRCPAAILLDRRDHCCWLVAEAGNESMLEQMADDLATTAPAKPTMPPLVEVIEDKPERYLAGVGHIHQYLRAGDIFQVNLSRGWRARYATDVPPTGLFASLRLANPAPFAALFQWQGAAVLSSSPERLVCVSGESVQTRP
ncbi:MAG: chorismate-binding protein, partial [Dokdonella sp.]